MSDSLVTIRDLHVELGGHPVLRGVNADLERGFISALIGLNGSGKTTLLRTLVKEVPYRRGEIRFHCGHDHRRPAPEHVGYVPQKLRIEARLPLTVKDLFGLTLQRRPLFFGVNRHVRTRMRDLLDRVGALGLQNRLVEKLSGGQLQRVLLALALEPNPELLLLDEPAAGIDFKDVEPFYALLGELNKKTGITVLLVSHELNVVSRLAHRVFCLEDGRIKCHGSPSEVLTSEVLAQTFGTGSLIYHHHGHDHCVTASPSSPSSVPPARTS
jgi:zinc transport system ATP-binding protein